MDSKALKFLLNLLSFPNYRAPIRHVKPTPKIKTAEKNYICQKLRDRDLVACSEKVKTLKISAPGKALLKLGQVQAGLTPKEFQVLQEISVGKISPNQINLTESDCSNLTEIIENLAAQNLLVLSTKIDEVWLTEKGQKFLIEEYDPSDHSGTINFSLLADYLRLIRQFYRAKLPGVINPTRDMIQPTHLPTSKPINQSANLSINELDILQTIRQLDIHLEALKNPPTDKPTDKSTDMPTDISPRLPSDEDILQLISQLDRELGTENYLPIFHLREKLKDLFSREELDQALYRLQANQQIQLKSLEEVIHYSPEYFAAAIPQEKAWSLFFIVRNHPEICGQNQG